MRLLLDTHIVIWSLLGSPRLSAKASELIMASENEIFVSAVSIWEIAIKRSIGKRAAPPFTGSETVGFCVEAGYEILNVTAAHGAAVEALPLLHGDPFDRMIVAQALTEPLVLVTHDATVAQYGDQIVRV